jgi:hypothetical protein
MYIKRISSCQTAFPGFANLPDGFFVLHYFAKTGRNIYANCQQSKATKGTS